MSQHSLNASISMAAEMPNKFKSAKEVQRSIKSMQKQCIDYKMKIEKAQNTESSLDKEIIKLKKMLSSHRAAIGGPTALRENNAAVKQQLDIMQRRLVHAQRRKLNCKSDLKTLVNSINSIRVDNVRQLKGLDELTCDQLKIDSAILRINKSIRQLNLQCEECEADEHELLEKSEIFAEKSRALLNKKESEEKVITVLEEDVAKKEDSPEPTIRIGSLSLEQERRMQDQIDSAVTWRKSTKKSVKEAKEKIETELFNRVKIVSGASNLNEFIEMYKSRDEENFRKLVFVNLEDQRIKLEKGLLVRKEKQQKLSEGHMSLGEDAVAVLDSKIITAKQILDSGEKKIQMLHEISKILQSGIKVLYNQLSPADCTNDNNKVQKIPEISRPSTGRSRPSTSRSRPSTSRKSAISNDITNAIPSKSRDLQQNETRKGTKKDVPNPNSHLLQVNPPLEMLSKLLGIIEFRINVVVGECIYQQQGAAEKQREELIIEQKRFEAEEARENSKYSKLGIGSKQAKVHYKKNSHSSIIGIRSDKSRKKVENFSTMFGFDGDKMENIENKSTLAMPPIDFMRREKFKGVLPRRAAEIVPKRFLKLVTRGPDIEKRDIQGIAKITSSKMIAQQNLLNNYLDEQALSNSLVPLSLSQIREVTKSSYVKIKKDIQNTS